MMLDLQILLIAPTVQNVLAHLLFKLDLEKKRKNKKWREKERKER